MLEGGGDQGKEKLERWLGVHDCARVHSPSFPESLGAKTHFFVGG
jgi:hypothetical protein